MAWRDNLLQASFRGVKFYVDSHTANVGRRNVINQFPYADGTSIEDLGLDADEYSIEAYVLQNADNGYDYFGERNKLINALKKYGPGTLVHPYLGKIRVAVNGKVSFSESYSQGGMCKFSIKFVVAGDIDYPNIETDPIREVDEKAGYVDADALETLADKIVTDDIPSWSLTSLYNDFVKFTNLANAYISRIRNSGGNPLRDFKDTIDSARSLVVNALQVPCQFGGLIFDVFDSVLAMVNVLGPGYVVDVLSDCAQQLVRRVNSITGDSIDNGIGLSSIDSLCDLAGDSSTTGFGSNRDDVANAALSPINIRTPDTARQDSNRTYLVNTVKAGAISTATRIAIRTVYNSLEESQERIARILACIDYLMFKIGDESASDPYSGYGIYTDNRDLYNSLAELRSVFLQAIKLKTIGLARNTEYVVPSPDGVSALELAYSLYGDIERLDEIYARNRDSNEHPGFMTETQSVLSE